MGQKYREGGIGSLARNCLQDPQFPKDASHIDEVFEYFKKNNASKKELKTVKKAWDEFRTLEKVKVHSLNLLKSN